MGLFSKKKKASKNIEQGSTETKSTELALIMLVERCIPDIKNYFSKFGIEIEQVYTDIEEAKIGMLIQSGKARIVIVDSGLAHFTTTAMRAEVKDLLGLCDGEDKFGTVFYTDTILKSDNTKGRKSTNAVDWEEYTGTQGIIEKLKKYKETYISSSQNDTSDRVSAQEILSFKGEHIEPVYSGLEFDGINVGKLDNIMQKIKEADNSDENSLTRFEVKY